jgi:hypothetical protein
MFPVTYNPWLKYCILVPSFDPLFESPAEEAGLRAGVPRSPANGLFAKIEPTLAWDKVVGQKSEPLAAARALMPTGVRKHLVLPKR